MKRALFYVFCAVALWAVARHVKVGNASLWQQGKSLYNSTFYQKGIKGLGDRVLEQLRPGEKPKDGKGAKESCLRPKAELLPTNERGPDSERDLPPAPIPPPKEPLLHNTTNALA